MLVHICCSVDSHYFLQKLAQEYPDEKLIGFFYDPNIHPLSEYTLRLLDVKRSCEMLGIELIEGAYDTDNWLKSVSGLENEPEKGKRCSVCFDDRFMVSALKAKELGEDTFTSTLLVSPKKSISKLKELGDALAKQYNLTFITPDYRSNGGTQEQNIVAKKDKLYRQDYCGCIFGLLKQRAYQNRVADELFSPISQQILQDAGASAWWRPNAATPVSWSATWRICAACAATRFITLAYYNQIARTNYVDIKALVYNPPNFKDELEIRTKIAKNPYNLSSIIITEKALNGKIEIYAQSEIYEDIREIIKIVN
ncbi:MAG: epoxyqueuosine reductase QueH [Sulfurovaceae bacterium]